MVERTPDKGKIQVQFLVFLPKKRSYRPKAKMPHCHCGDGGALPPTTAIRFISVLAKRLWVNRWQQLCVSS